MSEGADLNMMNRKSTRILITMVLAAAICSALGSEAHAAWDARGLNPATLSSHAPKPALRPFSGEPDAGGATAPLPPKAGNYPTSGQQMTTWTQRVQWMVRIWLGSVPKRFP